MPPHVPTVWSASLDVGTPAFVLERRGRHKPLSSYFEDAILDREGSADRETGSHRQSGSRTQEGLKQGRKVDIAAGSSDAEIHTNSMLRPTPPDDEGSVTGEFKFRHQFAHDPLTSLLQSQKQKLTSTRSHSPSPNGNTPLDTQNLRVNDRSYLQTTGTQSLNLMMMVTVCTLNVLVRLRQLILPCLLRRVTVSGHPSIRLSLPSFR